MRVPTESMADGNPDAIVYRLVRAPDIGRAAEIYMEHFSRRLVPLFRREDRANAFCVDLMEWMRRAFPDSFFGAYVDQGLVGYLILTRPRFHRLRALASATFLARLVGHVLLGRYGFSLGTIVRLGRRLLPGGAEPPVTLSTGAHVYVVAVDGRFTGRRIGATLLAQARQFAQERYGMIWLLVEDDNPDAIRFYERLGFSTVARRGGSHTMCWDLAMRSPENWPPA